MHEELKVMEPKAGAATKLRTKRVRAGRPPLERAGEVDERILDAAHKVFLDRGFDGASIDLIAETARSGKPTIYARFRNKEELFAAALTRQIDARNARLSAHKPVGATIEERLTSIGAAMLKETLTKDHMGLFHLAMAEQRRFPELVAELTRMAKRRGVETVARLLVEAATCGEFGSLPAGSEGRSLRAAEMFGELILLPFLMRALSGESMEALHADIDDRVARKSPSSSPPAATAASSDRSAHAPRHPAHEAKDLAEGRIKRFHAAEARLHEDRLFLGKGAETPFAVIGAHAARADPAEGLRFLREMQQAIVPGDASGNGFAQQALAEGFVVAEAVERQRTVKGVDMGDGLIERIIGQDRQQRAEDFLLHDRHARLDPDQRGRRDLARFRRNGFALAREQDGPGAPAIASSRSASSRW